MGAPSPATQHAHQPDAAYPSIQAEQQHFAAQPVYQAQPAAVAQGTSVGPMAVGQPLYCPPDQQFPVYLGAREGHAPIPIHCGTCGYQGMSDVRTKRGWAHGMWAMMTLGIGLLVPVALDSHHFCPNCGKHVAEARLM